jgi:hypothetical protein
MKNIRGRYGITTQRLVIEGQDLQEEEACASLWGCLSSAEDDAKEPSYVNFFFNGNRLPLPGENFKKLISESVLL